jgi:predicted YcjX-like family ATPase
MTSAANKSVTAVTSQLSALAQMEAKTNVVIVAEKAAITAKTQTQTQTLKTALTIPARIPTKNTASTFLRKSPVKNQRNLPQELHIKAGHTKEIIVMKMNNVITILETDQ